MDTDENDNGGVPIRKLYVANFPYNATSAQLKLRFEQFGAIKDVYIHKQKDKGPKPYAFITFEEEAGAKAAREKVIHMLRRKLVIRAADPWHQPDFKEVDELELNQKVEQNVAGTILMLNDDCLLKILEYLPDRDLLKVQKVCWRLRSVVEMIYKSYKVFDSENYVGYTVMELRTLLFNAGPYIKTLRVKHTFNSSRNMHVLRFAALYCTNLTELTLRGIEVSYKIKNIHNLFRNLTKLAIESSSVSDQDLIYLLKVVENNTITDVNLSSNLSLTGKCLSQLNSVKVANLYSCVKIERLHFIDFLRENPQLEELNIILCDKINAECITEIAKLSCLKKLAISNGYAGISKTEVFSALKELKCLRHLEIRYVNYGVLDNMLLEFSTEVPLEFLDISCGQMTKTTLDALMNFKTLRGLKLNRKKDCADEVLEKIARLKTLEEFSCAACHGVTDQGVLEVVRMNPKLRFLDLSCIRDLTKELLPELAEMTKGRSQMLTLRVGGSSLLDSDDSSTDLECEKKVADNLHLELSSTFSTYLGSSDEASSDGDYMDYDYWDDFDDDDSSELSADSEYAARLLFDMLRYEGAFE